MADFNIQISDGSVRTIPNAATKIPTVCLNMIVKNESRVILRLLKSVASFIDSYCICDTGSTDSTIDLIVGFFKERGIPGKICQEPFRDFGYNRTYALNQCEIETETFKVPDYVLLLDADMIFQYNGAPESIKMWLLSSGAGAFHMYQGSDSFYYKNTRIVKTGMGTTYWGVTHEYVKTPENTQYRMIERDMAFIRDIGDGGAKSDKFERDIRLLTRGLEEHPNNDRYTFYLANSYRDNGNNEQAIEYYKKRIELGGWADEVWHSYYSIGKCYRNMGDMTNAIYWWLEAYQYMPKRVENLYEIITYYRQKGKNQLAYLFYVMALKQMLLNPNPDYLFLQREVYAYKLDYEFSIFGYYCNIDNYDLTRISVKVLNCDLADNNVCRNVLSNYKFYAKRLSEKRDQTMDRVFKPLYNIGLNLELGPDFRPSTPSMVLVGSDTLAVCRRYVNYYINDAGGYENREHITTHNQIAFFKIAEDGALIPINEYTMPYDAKLDNLYVGLEDVRLLYDEDEDLIFYSANRGLSHHNIAVESGVLLNTATNTEHRSGIVQKENRRPVEKNWVLFTDRETKEIRIIYGWSDLVIGSLHMEASQDTDDSDDEQIRDNDDSANEYTFSFVANKTIKTPPLFKHLRGSTNGVHIGNEIWFICHIVSYEDRRYYYHVFVALDAKTYEVRRHSVPFTFEGEKVEYTLGFVYMEKEQSLWIGYSTMDRNTFYISVSMDHIIPMMIHV